MEKKFIAIVLLLSISCTEQSPYWVSYKITNGLSDPVALKFYRTVTYKSANYMNSESTTLVYTVNLKAKGDSFSQSKKVDFMDGSDPNTIFESDSLVVIFNNSRKKIHYDGFPQERNLFTSWAYSNKGEQDDYEYTITDEDYENATPCDGPCN